MPPELRKSGIAVLGDIAWGTHFCQFYENKKDLLDVLVPYFKAGLDNNEFCVWVTADPVSVNDAFDALKNAMPNFNQVQAKNSIEILHYKELYLESGRFEPKAIHKAWMARLETALHNGYDGLRVNGNETWLSDNDWENFMQYERELTAKLQNHRIIVLCTYPLSKPGTALFDVAHAHECAVAKRKGKWEILEEPEIKKRKSQLKEKSKMLEKWVTQRTNELAEVIDHLRTEIEEHKKTAEELSMAYKRLRYHVENTPLAIIEWDKDLFITRWSGQAEKIFGWTASEALGKNMYVDKFPRVYEEDQHQVEKTTSDLTRGLVERNVSLNRNYTKDERVIYCEWYNSVLRDEDGNVITIMSLTHDVTERIEAEEKLNESYREIRSLSEHLQNIREDERTHIAREIHDELGQQLTVMKMNASWLNKKLSNLDHGIKERLDDLIKILNTMVRSVRRISYELRPHLLDLGLVAAMEWHIKEFGKRTGIETSFVYPQKKLDLPDAANTGLFRIFQESLTNIARHAEASKVNVELTTQPAQLILQITDNGKGFDKKIARVKKTLGLLGIKERAAMMGGHCAIESQPGKGTTLMVIIPFDQNAEQ